MMFEWLTGSKWYITIANVCSFIGSITFLFLLLETQRKVIFLIIIVISFILACVFGWFPNIIERLQ